MNSMLTRIIVTVLPLVAFGPDAADPNANRVAVVTQTPGCVAFWDFVTREPDGAHRYTAHVPEGAKTDYPLDAANYIKDYWGAGREATYADFPLLGRGPFGNAVRIVNETDPEFRPFLFVPRARLHDSPLDIKGACKSATVVVWAIRESGNHALAGIWREGTDLKQKETAAIQKVQRGQRQYALFAGLYQFTGDEKYRTAAIRVADVLAANARADTATRLVWPYRVRMDTVAITTPRGSGGGCCCR
jgi:hypothetical protein